MTCHPLANLSNGWVPCRTVGFNNVPHESCAYITFRQMRGRTCSYRDTWKGGGRWWMCCTLVCVFTVVEWRFPRAAGFTLIPQLPRHANPRLGPAQRRAVPTARWHGTGLLRMRAGETSDDSDDPNKIGFVARDAELVKAMADEEAKAGNATGAQTLSTIADRMQTIMDRSTAKMSKKLDVPETAGEGETSTKRSWPFLHPGLVAKGSDVYVSSVKDGPKSARGADSFEAGDFVSWRFRINQLAGPICIGLTSLAVDLDRPWSLDEYFNEAMYITQNGNLYNGGALIWEGGRQMKMGDIVEITLDGDMVYIAVNDEPMPASLGPITSSLRVSVQLSVLDDGLSLLEQRERSENGAKVGTLTIDQNARKQRAALDDEDSIISSLFANTPESELIPERTSTFSDSGTADLSDLSADEPLDIFALNSLSAEPGPASSSPGKADSQWEMLVSDTGKVYYWNKERDTTTWVRPADYDGPDTVSVSLDADQDIGRLLDKTTEDTSDVLWNNADGLLDSYKTVKMDEDGYPSLDRFVYVDEETCIGCTNCATVSRSTFMMTDELGRARVFRQGGDSEDLIAEAVDTCPVDCIWYVSWDDLIILETERKYKRINNQARLVGGSNIEATGYEGRGGWGVYANEAAPQGPSKASIMSGGTRCNNCPGRGCRDCPLYGVGQNPEYERRKKARKAKRKMKSAGQIDSLGVGNSLSDDVDLSKVFSDDSFTDDTDFTATDTTQ